MSAPPAKKSKYLYKKKLYQSKRKHFLEVGQRGFLATCNFNEKDCIRECYNILNQYANELYGIEDDSKHNANVQSSEEMQQSVEEPINDISDELQMQISASQMKTKSTSQRRFQAVDTGAANCVFIKTTLEDPKQVAESIINDILETKQQKIRHLLRFLPIDAVCKANEKDILNAAGQLCDKFFLKDHTTFSIVYNKRFNNGINRDNLIREIANLIHAKNLKNKVDLKHAKRSLVVEIIKGLCCLTVVDDYIAKKKYNLFELSRDNREYNKEGKKTMQVNGEKNGMADVCELTQHEDEKTTAEIRIENERSDANEDV